MAEEHVYTQICPQCKLVNAGTAASCERCNHKLTPGRYRTRGELFYQLSLNGSTAVSILSGLFLLVYFWNASFTGGFTQVVLGSGWVPLAVMGVSLGFFALFLRARQRPFFQRHPTTLQILLVVIGILLLLGFLMLLASSAFSRSGFVMTLLLLSSAVAEIVYRNFPVGSRWLTTLSSLCGAGSLWFLADLTYKLPTHMIAPVGTAASIDLRLGLALACLTGTLIIFSYKLTLLHRAEGSVLIGKFAKISYYIVTIVAGFAVTLLSTTLDMEGLVISVFIVIVFVVIFVVGK